jgi:hypothetical protein
MGDSRAVVLVERLTHQDIHRPLGLLGAILA